MRRAVDEFGQTIVMVTHDPTAAAYADRIVFLADGQIVAEMSRADGRAGHRPDEADRPLTMIGKITRKSMRARWGRDVFIGLAIMLGVSFVAGSFVLADSLERRSTTCSASSTRTSTSRCGRRSPSTTSKPCATRPGLARRRDRGGRGCRHRRAVAATASHSCSTRTATRSRRKAHPRSACRGPRTQWHLTASRSRTARHPTGPVEVAIDKAHRRQPRLRGRRRHRHRVRLRHRNRSRSSGWSASATPTASAAPRSRCSTPRPRGRSSAPATRTTRSTSSSPRAPTPPRSRRRSRTSFRREPRSSPASRSRGGVRRHQLSSSRSSATGLLVFAFITAFVSGVHHQQRVRHHDRPAPA